MRIPAAIMEAPSLSLDETVDIREEAGRIIIDPVRPIYYDLAQLLADITPENQHAEVSFGPAVGKKRSNGSLLHTRGRRYCVAAFRPASRPRTVRT